MKVILKFPLYVVAEFESNVDRAKATKAIHQHLWPHLSEYLTDVKFKRSVVRDLADASGAEVTAKIITELQLLQQAGK